MICYRASGRILAVRVTGIDENLGRLRIAVIIDRQDTLNPANVAAGEDRWQVRFPAELYDGEPHRIALDILVGENSIDRTAFSFAASTEPVELVIRHESRWD